MANLNLPLVDTPKLSKSYARLTNKEIYSVLTTEISRNGGWNRGCTSALKESPRTLLSFDRLSYMLGNAFGNHAVIILLNPKMIFCYHPDCYNSNKNPYHLQVINNIQSHIVHHLARHSDEVGSSMHLRFKAVHNNWFITKEELDEIAPSPYSLLAPMDFLNDSSQDIMKRYGIRRDFNPVNVLYTGFWKGRLLIDGVINSSALSFQEDDALVALYLSYPEPIKDWSVYKTISFYFLKTYCYVSSTALNLLRGITRYKRLSGETDDRQQFMKNINHPGPSLTTIDRWMPSCNYDLVQCHTRNLLCHLETLQGSAVPVLTFPNRGHGVLRFVAVLVGDGQGLNSGTFEKEKKLPGLSKPISISEIKAIGINNIPRHILDENPFIKAVQEYRITDMGGTMCSNVMTKFEGSTSKGEDIAEDMVKVINLSKSCMFCLKSNSACKYVRLMDPCQNCEAGGRMCISLTPFHLLWDMASYQVAAADIMKRITIFSSEKELEDSRLVSIGYGGLHMAKAAINVCRNYMLHLHGQRFGINVLRAMRNEEDAAADLLRSVKNAVFVAKDRQSDFLSYCTSSEAVTKALKTKQHYNIVRTPEKIMTYIDTAKKHERILQPVSIDCNSNGDVFILDRGSCSIHVLDNGVVARMFELGTYGKYDQGPYPLTTPIKASKVKFGEHLTSMAMLKDIMYVTDISRKELIIFRNCQLAKHMDQSLIHVVQSCSFLSVSFSEEKIILLSDENVVEISEIDFPSTRKYSLFLKRKTLRVLSPSMSLNCVFSTDIPGMAFGCWTKGKSVIFFTDTEQFTEVVTSVISESIPSCSSSGSLLVRPPGESKIFKIAVDSSGLPDHENAVSLPSSSIPALSVEWGHTVFTVGKCGRQYYVEESGPLEFAVSFLEAINQFYNAISYRPPYGAQKKIVVSKLSDSIKEADAVIKILSAMQEERDAKYPKRTTFQGPEGSVYSTTIDCFIETVSSWKAILRRLDHFDTSLKEKVSSRCINNESPMEHSFGFTVKKSQFELQPMDEYISNKCKHETDFLMRNADLPFCQYTKVKLRDKGYQELCEEKSKLNMDVFWNIFMKNNEKEVTDDTEEPSEEDLFLLHQAYLMTKTVPRRSNRSHWKEKSGFGPTMLPNQSVDKLFAGDLVMTKSFNNLIYLKVLADVSLENKEALVPVSPVDNLKVKEVSSINDLLVDEGTIVSIPESLYQINATGYVTFRDVISGEIDEMINRLKHEYCGLLDNEIAQLPSVEPPAVVDVGPTDDSECDFVRIPLFGEGGNEIINENVSDDVGESEPILKKIKRCTSRISDDDDVNEEVGLGVDKWVVVRKEDHLLLGHVISVTDDQFDFEAFENKQSNFFKKRGGPPISCAVSEALLHVNAPSPANNRGAWRLEEADFKKLKKLL